MGISLELVNFNLMFNNKNKEPIVVNDLSESTEDEKEAFNKLIYTKYNSDLLSILPTCECGETVGEYNVGIRCSECGTIVSSPTEQELEPLVWLRAPVGVKALINPIVWTMLSDKFTRSGFDIIRWICDTNYKTNVRIPAIMESVYALGIERGFNNFIDNFDFIIDSLFELKGIKKQKGVLDPMQVLLREYRQCVFCQYLPLPNRALLVLEETNLGAYADNISTGAVDAIRTMAGIDSELSSYSIRTKENRTIKTIAQLAEYYDQLARTTLAKKEGIFRKHVFGTRSHFSFRAVISSITDAHRYDELYIPWGIGISVLRIHLVNKLLRRGFNPNSAIAFLNEHSEKYHPMLDELFNLLISESPYKAIPVIFQRN